MWSRLVWRAYATPKLSCWLGSGRDVSSGVVDRRRCWRRLDVARGRRGEDEVRASTRIWVDDVGCGGCRNGRGV